MWKWIAVLCVAYTSLLSAETKETPKEKIKILALAGSTRKDSFNKKLIAEATRLAQQMGAEVTLIDLKDFPMPFYDADLEAKEGMPLKAKSLRQLMIQSQVIFIASPEYNGSLSAVLKNALDWASRDEKGEPSRDAFKGKKFALMSTSAGPSGGARGLIHLRAIIEGIGGTVLSKQVVVPDAYNAFTEQGKLKNAELEKELEMQVQTALSH